MAKLSGCAKSRNTRLCGASVGPTLGGTYGAPTESLAGAASGPVRSTGAASQRREVVVVAAAAVLLSPLAAKLVVLEAAMLVLEPGTGTEVSRRIMMPNDGAA